MYTYMCMYTYTYMCMRMCMCTYVCTYVHIGMYQHGRLRGYTYIPLISNFRWT